jgi:hypothetical protein
MLQGKEQTEQLSKYLIATKAIFHACWYMQLRLIESQYLQLCNMARIKIWHLVSSFEILYNILLPDQIL